MILALDTATKCGYATRDGEQLACGVWPLDFGPGRPYSCRQLNLWERLDSHKGVELVALERPVVVPGRESAARVCLGLASTVEMWCELRGVELREVQISRIKKHATGRGNAKKTEMYDAAVAKWPELRIPDDNAADALFLLDYVTKDREP